MGCMNIVIYLIQHMANPDVQTVRGETPMHLAVRSGQTDIIRVLLRNGAQVDAKARVNLAFFVVKNAVNFVIVILTGKSNTFAYCYTTW